MVPRRKLQGGQDPRRGRETGSRRPDPQQAHHGSEARQMNTMLLEHLIVSCIRLPGRGINALRSRPQRLAIKGVDSQAVRVELGPALDQGAEGAAPIQAVRWRPSDGRPLPTLAAARAELSRIRASRPGVLSPYELRFDSSTPSPNTTPPRCPRGGIRPAGGTWTDASRG